MGKRFDHLLFPGGRRRAFTMSFDDGVVQDRRLTALFRQYGVKGTFNVSAGVFGHRDVCRTPGKPDVDASKLSREEAAEVYAGQEIGGHGLYHSDLETVGAPLAMYEISRDKAELDRLAGEPLRMFAYPYGKLDGDAAELLRLAGYQGARTTRSTHDFGLPEDFLRWDPTCHQGDPALMELAERFLTDTGRGPRLFYVWGHGYEFDRDGSWERMEDFLRHISGREDAVWYASNGEILAYVTAYRRLEYSADGSMIRNPSAVEVTLQLSPDGTALRLPAGACTPVPEVPL